MTTGRLFASPFCSVFFWRFCLPPGGSQAFLVTTGRMFASPFFIFFWRFCLPPGGKPCLPGHDGEAIWESFLILFLRFCFPPGEKQGLPGHYLLPSRRKTKSSKKKLEKRTFWWRRGGCLQVLFAQFFFEDFVFLQEEARPSWSRRGGCLQVLFSYFFEDFVFLLEGSHVCLVTTGRQKRGRFLSSCRETGGLELFQMPGCELCLCSTFSGTCNFFVFCFTHMSKGPLRVLGFQKKFWGFFFIPRRSAYRVVLFDFQHKCLSETS